MKGKKKFPSMVLAAGLALATLLLSHPALASEGQGSPSAAELLKQAEEALTAGDFAKADPLLREIVDKHANSGEADTALYRLGDALFFNKDLPEAARYQKAVQAYKEALRRDAKSPLAEWALLQIANAYRLQGKFFMASTFYQRLVREYPEGRFANEALFGRAESYYGIRQFTLAHELYSSFAARYPDDERALAALVGAANSLYYLEKYDEALAAYGKVLAHPAFSPSVLVPEVRYSMAETCFRTKNYRCAKERFTEFYNLYPQNELADEALARMGDVYMEMGEAATALTFYEEVIALYPESDGAAISSIRMADLSVDNPEIAKRLAVMSPDFDPMDSYDQVASSGASKLLTELAHYKRAQLLSQRGKYSESIREFQRLREKYPTGNLAEHSRAAAVEVLQEVVESYLAKGEEFKAIEAYLGHQGLVQTTDFEPYGLYTLVGRAYLQNKMPSRAAELLKRVVEVDFPTPSDEEASWLLGKAYLEDGALEDAERQLKSFLSRYPSSRFGREARFALGKALFLSKKFTEALKAFEAEVSLAEAAPFSTEALLYLARTEKALARRELAVLTYEKLLSKEEDKVAVLEPWRREAAYELGDLLFETGSVGKALAVYQEALKLYPEDHRRPWAELQVARAYQSLGRKQEAGEAYQALASQGGGSLLSQVAAEYREALKVTP